MNHYLGFLTVIGVVAAGTLIVGGILFAVTGNYALSLILGGLCGGAPALSYGLER